MASPSWVYDLGRTSTCQGGDPNLMFESTSFAISETLIDHQLLIGGWATPKLRLSIGIMFSMSKLEFIERLHLSHQ